MCWNNKVSILSKLICTFNVIPVKIPIVFFLVETGKLTLKFVRKCKDL